jgi:excisionase family DNA binding protein
MRNDNSDNGLDKCLWTVEEVAGFLRIHPKTVYEWVARDELPCFRIGNRLRFSPTELTRWVSARKEE